MFANNLEQYKKVDRSQIFNSARLIFNPVAGQNNPEEDLEKIKAILEPEIKLDICLTSPEVDADQLAHEAVKQGVELIIASGGDGTISKTAKAVIGTNVPLALIPRGTANALANALGIATTIEGACQLILEGTNKAITTATCNNKPMLLLAGIGFEAETVANANRQAKKRFGILAYIFAGIKQLTKLKKFIAYIETEDRAFKASVAAITVANVAPPTSILAHGIGQHSPDSDLLNVTFVAPKNFLAAIAAAIDLLKSALFHIATDRPDIGYLQTRRIKITTSPAQKITVDGELLGTTPVVIEAVPKSLNILIPCQKLGGVILAPQDVKIFNNN